jgi:hypothetical protein
MVIESGPSHLARLAIEVRRTYVPLMGTETTRAGRTLVAVSIALALVSIILAPTVITDKTYWRPLPIVFIALCSLHIAFGSDYARGFLAMYLAMFGGIRVFLFGFALAMDGPVERNLIPMLGVVLGLGAAGILTFASPLREFVQVRRTARSGRQVAVLRAAWILVLIYLAVITYLDFTGPA